LIDAEISRAMAKTQGGPGGQKSNRHKLTDRRLIERAIAQVDVSWSCVQNAARDRTPQSARPKWSEWIGSRVRE
jgi:hypothetical protein